MQPKPIDSRRLLDIDTRNRLVDNSESVQHLRGVVDHKEHPAETDYDIIHDEMGRRNRDEAAKQFIDRLKRIRAERAKKRVEATEDESEAAKNPPNGQRGSHLDVEA
ncbi:MAG: hypothetical protein JSV16_06660 [Candidatus Hydrogenedentota bacterium]|nr:MAG: hypothetical protein JSV16_06660 [Candidatus Hydrogenedentota bacterium]